MRFSRASSSSSPHRGFHAHFRSSASLVKVALFPRVAAERQLSGLLGAFDYFPPPHPTCRTDGPGTETMIFWNRTPPPANFGYAFSDTNQLPPDAAATKQQHRGDPRTKPRSNRPNLGPAIIFQHIFSVGRPVGIFATWQALGAHEISGRGKSYTSPEQTTRPG